MAAAASGSRRRPIKPLSCLPSCFYPSSVNDGDDSSPPPKKLCKAQKRSKITTKILAHKSSSTQSHDSSHNRFYKHCSFHGAYLVEHIHDPVQNLTRTSTLGSPELTRPAGSAQTHPSLDALACLIIVTMMLIMTLSFGRLFAIFCTCICFCLIPLRQPLPQKMKVDQREVDMDSEEYKKKVVLMGLLERKVGMRLRGKNIKSEVRT